jgi:hypothetical protein
MKGTLLPLCLALTALAQEEPGPKERFNRFDQNRDGQLSRQEFPGPPKVFDRLDRDGDGFLTREEMRDSRRGRGHLEAPPEGPGKRPNDAAPAVGAPAPRVQAQDLADDRKVDLSQVRRVTVLIFGSHT